MHHIRIYAPNVISLICTLQSEVIVKRLPENSPMARGRAKLRREIRVPISNYFPRLSTISDAKGIMITMTKEGMCRTDDFCGGRKGDDRMTFVGVVVSHGAPINDLESKWMTAAVIRRTGKGGAWRRRAKTGGRASKESLSVKRCFTAFRPTHPSSILNDTKFSVVSILATSALPHAVVRVARTERIHGLQGGNGMGLWEQLKVITAVSFLVVKLFLQITAFLFIKLSKFAILHICKLFWNGKYF